MNVFVAGSHGMLASDLIALLTRAGETVSGGQRPEFDITDAVNVERSIGKARPDIVVNCAAYTAVDRAETDPEGAFAVNLNGAAHLARCCAKRSIPLIHLSTDFIFDGSAERPYREDDPPCPLNVYGESKLAGEEEVRERCPSHIIVRTSWLYGVHGKNFVKTILGLARGQDTVRIIDDQFGCPTWTADLARAIEAVLGAVRNLKGTPPWGTYHFCERGFTSWHGFAMAVIREARHYEAFRVRSVVPVSSAEFPLPALRPRWSVLDTGKIESVFGIHPRRWETALAEMLAELYLNGHTEKEAGAE
ncbi:dTDP-4-dehydrorhamnose reductase [Candidatus Latescibacterota bacterium]